MTTEPSHGQVEQAGASAIIDRRLRIALDGGRVLESIARSRAFRMLGATGIDHCSVDRVHFGSGLGHVVDYTLHLNSDGERRSLKAFGQVPFTDPSATFEAVRARLGVRLSAAGAQSAPQVALLDDIGVILRATGADERIEALPGVLARDSRLSRCGLPLAEELGQGWSGVELLSHRLGKRAVLRLSRGGAGPARQATAILKLYKRKSTAAAHCAAVSAAVEREAAEGAARVAIPRVYRLLDGAPGLLMEEVAGLPLHLVPAERRSAAHRAAGEALGRFHCCAIPGLVHYGVAEELDLLRRWLAFAARVRPSIPALLGPRVDRLAKDAVECEPHDPVPIHRDFHDKQVIVDGRSATLIDFDTVRAGDAAQDVGNFLAHIQLGAVQAAGGQTGTQAWRAFFDGYGSAALVPSRTNVDWHRRASLLRLALICGFSDSSSHMTETLAEAAGIEHERPDGLRSVQASGCC